MNTDIFDRGKRRRQQIILYASVIAILIGGSIVTSITNKDSSVRLTALAKDEVIMDANIPELAESEVYPPWLPCPLMIDERWADVPIGDTGLTIGENGSDLCALSFIYPEDLTPDQISERMEQAGAFTQGGSVNWDKAGEALPLLEFTKYETFEPDAAINALRDGYSVLARVQSPDKKPIWVCVYLAAPAGYLVADPRSGDTTTLSAYSNAVYTLVIAKPVG